MGIRQATPIDLDAVVDVVVAAMPLDPQWNYRFPPCLRQRYAKDHRTFTKKLFKLFIDPAYDDWHIMVAEAPSIEDPQVCRIVAFAVWDVSYANKSKHGPGYRPQNPMEVVAKHGGAHRSDADPAHVNAFKKAGMEGKQQYFEVYGDNQICLQILGTHPDYLRRGHGTNLCKWGMERAERDRIVLSVLASPLGRLLYTHLGFKFLGTIVVQAPGDEEKVYIYPMVLGAQ